MTEKKHKKTHHEEVDAKQPGSSPAKTTSLPSLTILFTDSWELFKKTVTSYIKVILLGFGLFLLLAMVGTLFALPISFASVSAPMEMFRDPTPFELANIIVLAVWLVMVVLFVMVFSLLLPIASIKILNGEKKDSTFDLLKQSMRLLLPYFVVTVISVAIILGGYFALLIPGLLFSFFFLFVGYQVVLEKQRGKEALMRSYGLVKAHFWQILGRFLLLEILLFSFSYVMELLSHELGLFFFLTVIIFFLAGWLSQSYLFTLYKQIRTNTLEVRVASMRWIWIVAGVGWLIFLGLLVTMRSTVSYMPTII